MFDSLARDLRFSGRLFAARRGWTCAAILCLAIATGANTAAFTVVNGLLLRPLPFEGSAQLVMVALRESRQTSTRPFALREYRKLADESAPTATLVARTFFPLSLAADDGARMAQAELVSGNYFEILRVTPLVGRFFDKNEDRADSPPVAVLSHRLWRSRFDANPSVVGQSIRVNGRPVTVAGIAPPGFTGAMQLVAADLWLPAAMYRDLAGSADADAVPMFGVMGRLTAGVTVREAEPRLTSIAAALARSQGTQRPPSVIVRPATGFGVPPAIEGAVLTLSGFTYLVMTLLTTVACANVAALVLARGTGRNREIAVRLSLGASRLQLARQLLTENLVLAIAGCAAGTIVALWLTDALVSRLTTPFQYVNYAIDVHPDVRVLVYSAVATVITGLGCGIVPIRHATRLDVASVLNQSAANGRTRESRRALSTIVAAQFAVSTMLLVAAGMLVGTYTKAASARPGFDASGVIVATLDMDQIRLDAAAGTRLYEQAVERLAALPGVANAGLTRDVPLARGHTSTVVADTEPAMRVNEPVLADAIVVSPHYFETIGVAIRQGRPFSDDEPVRPRVAIVSEGLATRLWPGRSPIGRSFHLLAGNSEPLEVVGTVPDVGAQSLTERAQPAFYQPLGQEYSARMTIVMRVHGDAAPFFAEVRRTILELNQDLAIVDLRTLDQLLDGMIEQRRIPAALLGIVALLGLLLSAVGLYGVMAHAVRERAQELGIRLALGARPADVQRVVLRQGLSIVVIGLVVGGAGTVVVVQLVRNTLFGIEPLHLTAIAAVCSVLIATGTGALYLPARWASRLEPAQTLRTE